MKNMKKFFLVGWLLISFSGMAEQNEASGERVSDEDFICVDEVITLPREWICHKVDVDGADRMCYAQVSLEYIEDAEMKSRIMQDLEDCMERHPEIFFHRLPKLYN